jgi:UDP-N-acetylglucosamine--N-acetylmuramyl-(pentapeptide) pyrophosphoryl-undecaprenol N-acetylglucosamine transferase
MRFLLTCAELGLGHVNRIIPLGKKLQKRGHKLYFISGGVAYQLLKKEFENVYPCTPISWYESPRGIMPSISLLNILLPLPWYDYRHGKLKLKTSNSTETVRRYYDIRTHVPKLRPDLIISDGDMISLRLGKKWKIPSIYITNIIRPTYRFPALLTPGERFTERYVKKCAKIIVPDTPKYTICEYNLGNLDELGIREKVEFVGTFSDMKYEGRSEKHIFAPISGPTGTKAKLARTIIPVLSSLESKSIVSLGEPDNKSTKRFGNCEVHGWLNKNQRKEYLKNAKIIIFSGGHGTCFEVIKHRKPSICMPTQPEQMGNAKKLDELNCSIYVENKRQLKLAIEKIEGNIDFFKNNIERLSEYSSRFSGLDGSVTVVENTLQS